MTYTIEYLMGSITVSFMPANIQKPDNWIWREDLGDITEKTARGKFAKFIATRAGRYRLVNNAGEVIRNGG